MRKIALTAVVLIAIATLGCSKKTEEQTSEAPMTPAPMSQEMAPAPMQGMDSESTQSPSGDSSTTDSQEDGQEKTEGDHTPSGME